MSGLGTYLYGIVRAGTEIPAGLAGHRRRRAGLRLRLRPTWPRLTSVVPRDDFESDEPGGPGLGRPQGAAA